MEDKVLDAKYTVFTEKEIYRYKALDKYFKNVGDVKIIEMINIINGKSDISLRLLDWFVTQYCKMNKVTYRLTSHITNKEEDYDNYNDDFHVYISYKAQLKTYNKKRFDPFRRNKKFYYPCKITNPVACGMDKDVVSIKLETTLGQLQFFKWAFDNEIVLYVKKNFDKISKSMLVSNKTDKVKEKGKKDKKSSSSNSAYTNDTEVVFD
jgi:hypothetical protein